ncbi:hypothetical protein GALMADRAFT_459857 [Galerina marginata CBS 339.88]|uniref:Uncharacterized protein n=1 Tax=Galerina marginata (strain CBS 339.88) TaxID=685588 RepID=A0A067T850_GALM3|nr:hypothetical protein GALMADRAFT_459857 [Galerina marginata CBS 339.88]
MLSAYLAELIVDLKHKLDRARFPASWIYNYNLGKFIEGPSYDTKDGYQLSDVLYHRRLYDDSSTNSTWQESNGLINQGSVNTSHSDTVEFKKPHLIATSTFSTTRHSCNTTSYDAGWRCPQPTEFSSLHQLAGLDILSTAI